MRPIVYTAIISAIAVLGTAAVASQAATPAPEPVSGCVNQTLTDGSWNLKVTSVTLGTLSNTNVAAWGVAFNFGAATSKATSPSALGVGEPQVELQDGTKLDMSTSSEIAFSRAITGATFKKGTEASGTYWYAANDITAKAAAFLFPVDPNNSVYNTPYGYPVKNPSFHVDLTCKKN